MRIAGIDIGGTSIKAGIFEDGRLIHKTSTKTPFDDPQGVVRAIAGMLDGWNVQSVGVGTAGSVEFLHDTVSASNLGFVRVPLKAMLKEQLGVPVHVDNDAQAALMAEWADGACTGADNVLYLTLGTGIGGAMMIDGKPYRGRNNLGAEFGHMIIQADGPKCSCGRNGCLEVFTSASALRRLAKNKPTREIITGAISGNSLMRCALEEYARKLAIGLSNLIMLFDPDVIVLGGGISSAGDLLASFCQQELERIFSQTTDPLLCQVRIAQHQNDAGILGAAMLAPSIIE